MSHPETPSGEEAGGFQGTLPVTGPIQVGQGHEVRSRHCTESWSWVMTGPGGSPGHKPRCAKWPAWFKPHHLPVKNKTQVPPWWSSTSALPTQEAGVQSLVREPDPACCNQDFPQVATKTWCNQKEGINKY